MAARERIVGRRLSPERQTLAAGLAWLETVSALIAGPVCDRGVFRFAAHEEADQWMTTQRLRHHRASRPAKISSG